MNLIRITARRESGFSLVELMVGMVIGLIAIVVMFQVFAVTEGQRRTTTGAGDAQQNGVASLFLMERDGRMAGYGFNYTPIFGCLTRGFYSPTGANFSFTLLPVLIGDGGGHGSDSVTFTYGSSEAFALPAVLANDIASTPNFFKIEDPRFQFNPGDLVLAAQIPLAPAVMPNCWIAQVTGLPDVPYADRVQYGSVSYVDSNGTTRIAEYTAPFALPVAYTKWNRTKSYGGRLVNMGQAPVSTTYSIVNNQLVANNAFLPNNPMVISDGIVQLQVQYGFSADCPPAASVASGNFVPCRIDSTANTVGTIVTGSVNNQWGDVMPAGATTADWRKVVAVRMAIVARSTEPQSKRDMDIAGGICNATTSQPVWLSTGRTLWVDNDPNWQCYRYKVFELVVPIRNMMWYADPSGSTVPPA